MVFKLKGVGVREPLLFEQKGLVVEKEAIDLIKAFKKKTGDI